MGLFFHNGVNLSVLFIVALFCPQVKPFEHLSVHSICAAVDKEIRFAGVPSAWGPFCPRDNHSRQNEK
jgi:hypothetical protein